MKFGDLILKKIEFWKDQHGIIPAKRNVLLPALKLWFQHWGQPNETKSLN